MGIKKTIFRTLIGCLVLSLQNVGCSPSSASDPNVVMSDDKGKDQKSNPNSNPTDPEDSGRPVILNNSFELFLGPSLEAHQPFINLINGAKKSIYMEMFHVTDKSVIEALNNAAKRGVATTVILDGKSLLAAPYKAISDDLASHGVIVISSSSAFTITHSKSMVADDEVAVISSMNLTDHPEVRRDYGFVIRDQNIINDLLKIFNTDIQNAKDQTKNSPDKLDDRILLSPFNSRQKLLDLISSAKVSIQAVAENFLDKEIIAALIAARGRGVKVQTLSPACSLGANPNGNFMTQQTLAKAGVEAREMPSPATPSGPYLHGKMMVIDRQTLMLGSINFSINSIQNAREISVAVNDLQAAELLEQSFTKDFKEAKYYDSVPECKSVETDLNIISSPGWM